jgi:hypothetical protein
MSWQSYVDDQLLAAGFMVRPDDHGTSHPANRRTQSLAPAL